MSTPATCPRCAAPFECGIDTGGCWCRDAVLNDITRAAFAQYYDGCLCRECLTAVQDAPPMPSVREFLTAQLKRKWGRPSRARSSPRA
ncbi:MAG TPA: cysteine-rich CWC family protein [Solirubrobacteraceae bacterium]|nr:cysteine-rich CWC family protein [Solirubrobacteraceae bacterium]